jgi:hypothetical protein
LWWNWDAIDTVKHSGYRRKQDVELKRLSDREIVLRALVKVINLYGTHENVVKAINKFKQSQLGGKVLQKKHKLTVSTFENYLYREGNIRFDNVIAMAHIAEMSVDDFDPGNPMNNQVVGRNKNSSLLQVLVKDISTRNPECLREIPENRAVIIDREGVIIVGQARVEAYLASGIEYISVECIDLEALYSGTQTLENRSGHFLEMELGAIGLRVEHLLLGKTWCPGTTFEGRQEVHIAKMLGFGSRDTYRRIKQICLQGGLALMSAVIEGSVSIKAAAQIAGLPLAEQVISLQLKQKKATHAPLSNKQAPTHILKTSAANRKKQNSDKNSQHKTSVIDA